MYKFSSFLLFFFGLAYLSMAQNQNLVPNQKEKKNTQKYILLEQDSIVVDEIKLDDVVVFQRLNFDSKEEMRTYLILRRKTRKVWPYAVLASNRLEKLTERLSKLESNSKKKRYTKRIQKYIEEKFTDQLKKLTKTEGQILVKLMYRQTGVTTFDLVKDLKSGWRAFWYNSTASLFNISLKEKYDPYTVKEDYLIEDILQRSFRDGVLEEQSPAISLDYLDMVEIWMENEKSQKSQSNDH
jgi:hypothetical protein